MVNRCRVTLKNNVCAPTTTVENNPSSSTACSSFSVCLGAGKTLKYDGQCFSIVGTTNIPDGWYGQVKIEDGCIVDAAIAPIPVYTPPPCAPAPGEGGSGDTTTCADLVSPDSANLSYCSGGQLMTELIIGTQTGITITGKGTSHDPMNFVVSETGEPLYFTVSTPDVLTLTGTGTLIDPYILSMKNSPLGAGTHGEYTTDAYGRVIAYNPLDGVITSAIDGVGTTVVSVSPILQIDLTNTGVTAANYLLGGYTGVVNSKGQFTNITQSINITPGVYNFGDYDATVNAQGSITKLEATTPTPGSNSGNKFVKFFPTILEETDQRVMTIELAISSKLQVTYHGPAQVRIGGSDYEVRLGDDAPISSSNGDATFPVLGGVSLILAVGSEVITSYMVRNDGATIMMTGVTTNTVAPGTYPVTITFSGGDQRWFTDGWLECEIVAGGT